MRGLLHDWSESSDTLSSYHIGFEPVFMPHLVLRLLYVDLFVAWAPLRFDVADMGDFIRSPQFAGTLRADAKTLHMKCPLHQDKQSGVTLCLRYSGSLNLKNNSSFLQEK